VLSNKHLSEQFKVSENSITTWLKQLNDKYISMQTAYSTSEQTMVRKIYILPNYELPEPSTLGNNNIYIDNNNNNNKYQVRFGSPNIDELTKKAYEHIVKLFPEKTQPKAEQTKYEWKLIIQELADEGYNQRKVYNVCQVVRENHFWQNKFYTIKQLTKINKNGVKYIDYFLLQFKDEITY